MSSVNLHYTFNYSQPEEYRFSHDSVFLAREVFEITAQMDLKNAKLLDLCSGCGIVGLDFLFHRSKTQLSLPTQADFLEVQSTYQQHFNSNVTSFRNTTQANTDLRFINSNYETLVNEDYKNLYNLVLCNPPYFRTDQGVLSTSEFKNRCRFFIDSDFKHLIQALDNCTASGAQVYILLNSLKDHGVDIEAEISAVSTEFKIKKMGMIRSTDFWLLDRK